MSIWDDAKGRNHVGVMVSGKRVHRVLPEGATTRDAKLVEAEIRSAVARAPKEVNIPGDPPMSVILALYVEHSKTLRSAETSEFHAKRLGPWATKYMASQAQEFADHVIRDMRQLVEDPKTKRLKPAYAPATINRSLACAKKGLTLAWRAKLTHENHGLRIQNVDVNNRREVFLNVEDVRQIAQHCTEQAQAAIWAALLTGARRGELFQIRTEHIGRDTITLPASHTKTLRMRVIPIIPALRPWLKHFPLTITVDGMKSSWRRARVKARMEHVNFHDLRHSCASIMLSLGVDLYTISKILGNSNVQTTQRYAHLQVDAQRAALDKLSSLVQGKG
ncbi:tyrosine-type recombinase/integrase [Massilia pseudoviolaceinigra]|uniref:tyrosine-type recombinase/integrase n=1 Tax=Massilia pseudoviolaceinigra TaxID=3057165 RepID=UPI0027968BC3|nr:site-specific integrase [Massilia sp. CCM 9206]MDQ1921287.1 site-specific integrase [Massilia sp. CCM 9206]